MNVLDMKYASSVLERLADAEELTKKELFSEVRNNSTLDKLIASLEKAKLISVDERIEGRRVYGISLTKRGKVVAMLLKMAEKAARGSYPTMPEIDALQKTFMLSEGNGKQ